jgi:hypothetical protein
MQQVVWGRRAAPPWVGARGIMTLLSDPMRGHHWIFADCSQLVAAAVALFASIWTLFRFRGIYASYVVGSVALFTCNTTWASLPRYSLELFPLFIALGSARIPRLLSVTLLVVSASLLLLLATGFALGRPFY